MRRLVLSSAGLLALGFGLTTPAFAAQGGPQVPAGCSFSTGTTSCMHEERTALAPQVEERGGCTTTTPVTQVWTTWSVHRGAPGSNGAQRPVLEPPASRIEFGQPTRVCAPKLALEYMTATDGRFAFSAHASNLKPQAPVTAKVVYTFMNGATQSLPGHFAPDLTGADGFVGFGINSDCPVAQVDVSVSDGDTTLRGTLHPSVDLPNCAVRTPNTPPPATQLAPAGITFEYVDMPAGQSEVHVMIGGLRANAPVDITAVHTFADGRTAVESHPGMTSFANGAWGFGMRGYCDVSIEVTADDGITRQTATTHPATDAASCRQV